MRKVYCYVKEYEPSGLTPEELEKEIRRLEEESKHMTEWPDVNIYPEEDEYID